MKKLLLVLILSIANITFAQHRFYRGLKLPKAVQKTTFDDGFNLIPLMKNNNGKLINAYITTSDFKALVQSTSQGTTQIQSDWAENDITAKSFILNKPEIYTKTEVNQLINNNSSTTVNITNIEREVGSNNLKITKSDGNFEVIDITPIELFKPSTRVELEEIVVRLLLERGNNADLNDVDVSSITDFIGLFAGTLFNGNILQWNMSNAINTSGMFAEATLFNQNLDALSINPSAIKVDMFVGSPLEGNEPSWYNN